MSSKNVDHAAAFTEGFFVGGKKSNDHYAHTGIIKPRRDSVRLFILGDSQSDGYGETVDPNNWPNILMDEGYGESNFNLDLTRALGGWSLRKLKEEAHLNYVLNHAEVSGSVIVLWMGTNDAFYEYSLEEMTENYSYLAKEYQKAGAKVIAVTAMDRQHAVVPASYNAKYLAFNEWMRSNWTTFAHEFFDVAKIPEFSDATNSAIFQSDDHLTVAGSRLFAQMIAGKINAFA